MLCTSLFASVISASLRSRLSGLLVIAAACACAVSNAPAQSITTQLSNNGSGGVYLDLTPVAGALRFTGFATQYGSTAGSAVSVEVWIRTGSYVGFQGNAAGWTLYETVPAVSAGTTTTSAPAMLANPLDLPGGQTMGIYLQSVTSGGGIRYTGATNFIGTWSNAEITLLSEHANTGAVAFTGTTNTPRCFSGTIFYETANPAALGACCFSNGSCTWTPTSTYSDCQTAGGAFRGEGSNCSPNPCPQPGACCQLGGICSFVTQSSCASPTTPWTAGTCSPNPCPQPPANDTCDNAIALTPAGLVVNVDNKLAGPDVDPGDCTTPLVGNFGVWYKFTPAVDTVLRFDETSTQDIATGVWSVPGAGNPGVDCASFTGTNGICLIGEIWQIEALAGRTYYIQVGSTPTTAPTVNIAGTFSVLTPPSNDTCAGATSLNSLVSGTSQPFTAFSVSNLNAGISGIDIGACNSIAYDTSSVWFRYDATTSGNLIISETSAQAIAYGVWEMDTVGATCPTSGPATICDNAGTTTASEPLAIRVTPNKTYYIMIQTDSATFTTTALAGTFKFAPAPVHDDCSGATTLTLTPGTPLTITAAMGNNLDAVPSGIDIGTCNAVANDTAGVWFRYDAAANGVLVIDETSTQNIAIGIWEMPTSGAACPTAGPATFCSNAELFATTVAAGNTYYILIHNDVTTIPTVALAGSFTFVPIATNDDCASATVLTLTANTAQAFATDNRAATAGGFDIGDCNTTTTDTAGVWYRYAATASGTFRVAETSAQNIATGVWEVNTAGATCPVSGPATFCNNAEDFIFPVQSGKTYFILIHNDAATVPTVALAGTFTFFNTGLPANDNCSTATNLSLVLNVASNFTVDNSRGAADLVDPGACNTALSASTGGVWYRYNATTTGNVVVLENSTQNVAFGVWEMETVSATCPNSGPANLCSNAGTATAETIVFRVTPGMTYYVLVHTDSATVPTVSLNLSFTLVNPPGNDDCSGATNLALTSGVPLNFVADNRQAATSGIDIGTCNAVDADVAGLWYRYTSGGSGSITINETTAQVIAVGVWEVDTVGATCPVAGPANFCSTSQAAIFPVFPGKTYFILMHNNSVTHPTVAASGTFTLNAGPSNDICSTATVLVLPPNTNVPINENNVFATITPPEGLDIGTCNSIAVDTASVWYRYNATAPGALLIDETSTQDIATGIWETDTVGAACPTSGPATICNAAESFLTPVTPGKTYYILIHTNSATQPTVSIAGTFRFISTPSNDNCAAATVLNLPNGTPVAIDVDNRGATAEGLDVVCPTPTTDVASVWYRYDAVDPGTVILTETSTQDIAIALWEMNTVGATCPGPDTAPTVCTVNDTLPFTVAPGKTYYVLIQTNSTTPPTIALAGDFTFLIEVDPPANDGCATAADLTLPPNSPQSISVDNRGAEPSTPAIDVGTCNTLSTDPFSVWYKYTATAVGTVVFEETSAQNVAFGVWETDTVGTTCPTAGPATLCGAGVTPNESFLFPVRPNKTYYVLIHNDVATPAIVAMAGTATFIPAPASDDCAAAELLVLPADTPVTFAVDNRGATTASPAIDIGTCNAVAVDTASVWYRFDAVAPGAVIINETSTQNIAIGVWETNTAGATCPVAGAATLCTNAETLTFLVTASKTYYILIHNDVATLPTIALAGTFTFLPAPANDSCANAEVLSLIPASPATFGLDNRGAFPSNPGIDIGTCNLSTLTSDTASVWYRFDATESGNFTIAETSTQAVAIGIWEMLTPGATCPTAGPATHCSVATSFTFFARSGRTYYIMLHNNVATQPTIALAGTFLFVPRPENDDCDMVQVLSLPGGVSVPLDTDNRGGTAATPPFDLDCPTPTVDTASVWYRFDSTLDGVVVINETSTQNIATGVWDLASGAACPTPSMPPTFCNINENWGFPVLANRTYYILIINDATTQPTIALAGTFTFFPRPSNDNCSNVAILPLPPDVDVPFTSDNRGASPSTPPVDIGTCSTVDSDTSSIWFRYDAISAGSITIDETSTQDIAYGVFETDSFSATCPTAGPATYCSLGEAFTFPVAPDKTYFILIMTNSATVLPVVPMAGTFRFSTAPTNDSCPGATMLSLPPLTDVAFAVDNRASTVSAPPIDIGDCSAQNEDTASVWFRYDATAPGGVVINETSAQNIAFGVWEVDTAGASCPTAGPATHCSVGEAFTFLVTPGKTYYILIQNDLATLPTVPLAGTFTFVPPAANDQCAAAAVLSLPPGALVPYAVDNRGSTVAAPPINTGCSVATADISSIWFRFDAPVSGLVQFVESSGQDVTTSIFEVDTTGATCPIGGPANLCNSAETFFFSVTGNKTYYLMVQTDSVTLPTVAPFGSFGFFPPPTNETCASASEIAGPGAIPVYNVGALNPTDNVSVPCPTTVSAMNNDVWYKWTATATGTVAVSMRGFPAAFSGRYALYDGGPFPGTCPTAGSNLLLCNAFTSSAVTSVVPTGPVVQGNVYYLQLASQTAGTTGFGVLDFDFAPGAVGSCCLASCSIKTQGECSALGGLFTAGASCATPTATTSTYNGGGGPIPTGTTGTLEGVFQNSITVPDTFAVDDVEVVIDFTHTFQGDIIISLSDGTRTIVLHNRGRRGAGDAGVPGHDFSGVYTFSDAGTSSVFDTVITGSGSPVPPVTYKPAGVLGVSRGFRNTFNGAPANATWTLRIVDHVSGDSGTVTSWTLRLKQGTAPPCVAVGACCANTGTCSVVPFPSCTAPSIFQGQGSTCSGLGGTCPNAATACCNAATSACTFIAGANCPLGTFAHGGACSPNTCPTTGACCAQNGTCSLTTAAACSSPSIFQGLSFTCSGPGATCPNTVTACCSLVTGVCTFVGGTVCPSGSIAGGTICTPNPCSQTGACCKADGTCAITGPGDCHAPDFFLGLNFTCSGAGSTCPLTATACCAISGACTFVLGTTCPTNSTATGSICTPNPCPQPPLGACCNPNSSCTQANIFNCTAVNGSWLGPATSCVGVICPAVIISNFPQTNDSGLTADVTTLRVKALGFIMPAGSAYRITSVDGRFVFDNTAALPDVRIFNDDGTGTRPGTELAQLVEGAVTVAGAQTHTSIPAATVILQPSTKYWLVVLAEAGSGTFDFVGSSPSIIPTGVATHEGSLFGTAGISGTLSTSATINTYAVRGEIIAGACCDTGGACTFSPSGSAGCPGGTTYLGNGTFCSPNPCPTASGACCAAAGACTFSPTGSAGCPGATTYQGDGTSCTPNICPQPSVCCRGATCNTTITQANCLPTGTAGALFVQPAAACNPLGNSLSPCCYADYNKIGGRNVSDIFAYLSDWFAGSRKAVVGGNGDPAGPAPAVGHIFQFLTAWFAGGC